MGNIVVSVIAGEAAAHAGTGAPWSSSAPSMESWFSTYKSELSERFVSDAEAKDKTFDYIEAFYSTTRLHSALDYTSPARYERAVNLRIAA